MRKSRVLRRLRFFGALEQRYLDDRAPDRLRLLQMGAALSAPLSIFLLCTDWLMVRDQFDAALKLRLLLQVPLILAWLLSFKHLGRATRELFGLSSSVVAAGISIYLCLGSSDEFGMLYLVSMVMILLFNGGVVRMYFRMALAVNMSTLLLFVATLLSLPHPPEAIMLSMCLVMGSTALFSLFGSYWLEHEDRTNWLLSRQEQALLDELERGNLRLDEMSRHDPLTDLANRRYFDEFLRQVWERAQQSGEEVAVLMMDIDHFKHYNDHYGHPAGDACLKNVAAALLSSLRKPGDLVGRFGGEEFIAVLTKTSLPLAVAAAERVRAAVADAAWPHESSPGLRQITLSIGVSTMLPEPGAEGPAGLVADADAALYRAKAMGRNAVYAFKVD